MDIDSYQQCPCQNGKKVKFCCGKEVIHDLNDILSKNQSGQAKAALDQLDRTMERIGPKDCLLVIKTHILIASNEMEQALETNRQFRRQSPGHPMGLQHLALLDLADGRIQDAVNALQDAMDANKDPEIPIAVANVYRILAGHFFQTGRLIASLAHLTFALRLRQGTEVYDLASMYSSITGHPGSPTFLCQPFEIEPAPEDADWAKLYGNVSRAIDRGQFRRALQYLVKIDSDFDEHPVVVNAMAIVKSFLGREDAADAWRRYADLDGLNSTRRIEALAIAYEEDQSWHVDQPVDHVTVELPDFDRATEAMLSSRRFESIPNPQIEGFSPPPRHAFYLLNRDRHDSLDGIPLEEVPQRIAEVLVFGRQTDREARLMYFSPASISEALSSILEENLGDALGETQREPVEASIDQDVLFMREPSIPQDSPAELIERTLIGSRRQICLEEWPEIQLDQKHAVSIREAAQDPELKWLAYARLMILFSNSKGQFLPENTLHELVERLGLPALEPVGAEEPRALSSPILIYAVTPESVGVEQLEQALNHSVSINDMSTTRRVLREYLTREDRNAERDHANTVVLARCTFDTPKAIELIQASREKALDAGDRESAGISLIDELDLRLSRGFLEGAEALLADARNYFDIENVKFGLTRLLSQYGLLDDSTPLDAMSAALPDAQPRAAGAEPIAQVASSAEAPAATESKLWLPD